MFDLRYFYFHLREGCNASLDRVKRVKNALLHMRFQTFELREHLSYCSPLSLILHTIWATRASSGEGLSVEIRSIRRLEEAGIRNLGDLTC